MEGEEKEGRQTEEEEKGIKGRGKTEPFSLCKVNTAVHLREWDKKCENGRDMINETKVYAKWRS